MTAPERTEQERADGITRSRHTWRATDHGEVVFDLGNQPGDAGVSSIVIGREDLRLMFKRAGEE